jgi:zinc and cadmium transporter
MPLLLGMLVGLASVLAVVLAAALVVAAAGRRRTVLSVLLAFAAGTLLGAALLGLLPEAAAYLPLESVTGLVLLAIVAFLLLEKWVLWRHTHENVIHLPAQGRRGPRAESTAAAAVDASLCAGPAGSLILIGDSIHNLVDGVLLGATFVADTRLGLVVAVAVLAHEVPQEVGDFVILLESGVAAGRALAYNLASALCVFPGVALGYVLGEQIASVVGVALALSAGGFLYVALADLVPDLHHHVQGPWTTVRQQLVPLLAGVGAIWAAGRLGG